MVEDVYILYLRSFWFTQCTRFGIIGVSMSVDVRLLGAWIEVGLVQLHRACKGKIHQSRLFKSRTKVE